MEEIDLTPKETLPNNLFDAFEMLERMWDTIFPVFEIMPDEEFFDHYRTQISSLESLCKFGSSDEVDQYFQALEESIEILENMSEFFDKPAIIVMGPTGSGKSTAINYLSGREMRKEGRGFTCDDQVTRIEYSKTKSGTSVPIICHADDDQDCIFIDVPGTNDTRGDSINHIAHALLFTILKRFQTVVTFVLVLPHAEVERERGQSFKRLLEDLHGMIHSDTNIMLLVSKYNSEYDPPIDSIKEFHEWHEAQLQLLKTQTGIFRLNEESFLLNYFAAHPDHVITMNYSDEETRVQFWNTVNELTPNSNLNDFFQGSAEYHNIQNLFDTFNSLIVHLRLDSGLSGRAENEAPKVSLLRVYKEDLKLYREELSKMKSTELIKYRTITFDQTEVFFQSLVSHFLLWIYKEQPPFVSFKTLQFAPNNVELSWENEARFFKKNEAGDFVEYQPSEGNTEGLPLYVGLQLNYLKRFLTGDYSKKYVEVFVRKCDRPFFADAIMELEHFILKHEAKIENLELEKTEVEYFELHQRIAIAQVLLENQQIQLIRRLLSLISSAFPELSTTSL